MQAQTRYETNKNGEDIELNENEELCNKCGGTGEADQTGYFFPTICSKCQGEKKLDWVSRITGVAPKPSMTCGSGSSTSYSTSGPGHTHTLPNHTHGGFQIAHGSNITISPSYYKVALDEENIEINGKSIKEYVQEMIAEKLAKEVDEHIMRSFKIQKEQILNSKGRKFFGNGIISKLLLLCDPKQRFRGKNKKD
jgi:hypothetical protein